ncbi:hypothetical protein DFH09DRAFT_1323236 [Mycena vulgaris]|nr:hypothetical protein DFH09DRAFT_1323236 [Mycena vulgaris]
MKAPLREKACWNGGADRAVSCAVSELLRACVAERVPGRGMTRGPSVVKLRRRPRDLDALLPVPSLPEGPGATAWRTPPPLPATPAPTAPSTSSQFLPPLPVLFSPLHPLANLLSDDAVLLVLSRRRGPLPPRTPPPRLPMCSCAGRCAASVMRHVNVAVGRRTLMIRPFLLPRVLLSFRVVHPSCFTPSVSIRARTCFGGGMLGLGRALRAGVVCMGYAAPIRRAGADTRASVSVAVGHLGERVDARAGCVRWRRNRTGGYVDALLRVYRGTGDDVECSVMFCLSATLFSSSSFFLPPSVVFGGGSRLFARECFGAGCVCCVDQGRDPDAEEGDEASVSGTMHAVGAVGTFVAEAAGMRRASSSELGGGGTVHRGVYARANHLRCPAAGGLAGDGGRCAGCARGRVVVEHGDDDVLRGRARVLAEVYPDLGDDGVRGSREDI